MTASSRVPIKRLSFTPPFSRLGCSPVCSFPWSCVTIMPSRAAILLGDSRGKILPLAVSCSRSVHGAASKTSLRISATVIASTSECAGHQRRKQDQNSDDRSIGVPWKPNYPDQKRGQSQFPTAPATIGCCVLGVGCSTSPSRPNEQRPIKQRARVATRVSYQRRRRSRHGVI